jgi:hypothetical protein
MDETSILAALKDAAIDIMDLSARVRALEKKLERSLGVIDDICDCPNCDGLCSHEI